MKKNAGIFNLSLLLSLFLLLAGCQKGIVEDQANPLSATGKQGNTLNLLTVPPDVYVVGSEGSQAKYWKNGVGVALTGGIQATGIVVVGTDVYICGYGPDPVTSNMAAVYWKNGVLTQLSDGTDYVLASGIAVYGTDVYVSGKVGLFAPAAAYWKNGVETSLGWTEANGVFVDSNGDFYIPNGEGGNPSYWKNGTLVTMASGSYSIASVRGIGVNGTDVHAVGLNYGPSQTALYWKNGTLQTLSTPFYTEAVAIAFKSNGTPVIAGNYGTNLNDMHIAFWNGPNHLTQLGSGTYLTGVVGIAVDQTVDDVYVCGTEYISPATVPTAKYWTINSGGSVVVVSVGDGITPSTAYAVALGY